MKINVKRSDAKQRLFAYYWHRWFAWHPVKIGHRWIWLEWVHRRNHCLVAICYATWWTEYRFIPNTQAEGRLTRKEDHE